jgi:excinuclease UvrABC nuclease subunit
VVFGPEGPLKKDYRRFNITGVAPGDDYAALRQAVQRRYTRIREGEVDRPDLLLIDGGPAQLAGVREELLTLGFEDLPVIGVSKGADRRAGQCHRVDEAEARQPDRGLRGSGCTGGQDEVQQDLHHLLFPGRR